MKTTELILLICGGTLFLCSLAFMFLLFKKDKPMTKMIWFMILSFIMMGFSVISEANVVGLFEYKKEEVLLDVESLTNALAKCPENEEIKDQLAKKVNLYVEKEEEPETKKPEEIKKIGTALIALGNDEKAISYSDKILAKDTSNQVAKDVKKFAQTHQYIKEMPTSTEDRRKLARKIAVNIEELEKSPTVQKEQLIQLKNMYRKTVTEIKKTESQ
ncbi:hypothetical protein [uncultured Kordia sp.]|uniref:hypothetical protein n=1 Tax=uncultured Kordia sp. TaxID=507699 RepID=UPI0026396799|nr:hypothetical protein [uncultured Kordia sp.]